MGVAPEGSPRSVSQRRVRRAAQRQDGWTPSGPAAVRREGRHFQLFSGRSPVGHALGGLRMRLGKGIGMGGWDGAVGGVARRERARGGGGLRRGRRHARFEPRRRMDCLPLERRLPTPDFCGCGAGLLGQEAPAMYGARALPDSPAPSRPPPPRGLLLIGLRASRASLPANG